MLYADTAKEYKEQITSLMSSDNVSERLKGNRKFVVTMTGSLSVNTWKRY
jgi:hypothetical protein